MSKQNILLRETKVLVEQGQRFQAVWDEIESSWYLMVQLKQTTWITVRSKRTTKRFWKSLDTLSKNLKNETGCTEFEVSEKFTP